MNMYDAVMEKLAGDLVDLDAFRVKKSLDNLTQRHDALKERIRQTLADNDTFVASSTFTPSVPSPSPASIAIPESVSAVTGRGLLPHLKANKKIYGLAGAGIAMGGAAYLYDRYQNNKADQMAKTASIVQRHKAAKESERRRLEQANRSNIARTGNDEDHMPA